MLNLISSSFFQFVSFLSFWCLPHPYACDGPWPSSGLVVFGRDHRVKTWCFLCVPEQLVLTSACYQFLLEGVIVCTRIIFEDLIAYNMILHGWICSTLNPLHLFNEWLQHTYILDHSIATYIHTWPLFPLFY